MKDLLLKDKNEKLFENYFLQGEENSIIALPKVNKINLLVGANNSGKSQFIRKLLSIKDFVLNSEIVKFLELSEEINKLIIKLDITWKAHSKDNFDNNLNNLIKGGYDLLFFKNLNHPDFETRIHKLEFEKLSVDDLNKNIEVNQRSINWNIFLIELVIKYYDFEKYNSVSGRHLFFNFRGGGSIDIVELVDLNKLNESLKNIKDFIDLEIINENKHIFIPTLRTAHSLLNYSKDVRPTTIEKINEDIFKTTLNKNYKELPFINHLEIFTGLTLYNEIINARNDVKDKRQRFQDFEDFLSTNFFPGQRIDIVAKFDIYEKNDNKNASELINIYIDNENRNLFELGDGIQSLIILMYKIFMADNKTVIFIDEPEINLHPGMQRIFLDQITNNKVLTKKELTYFISTHSNHFLDLSIEKDNISIFSFNKKTVEGVQKFEIKNVNNGSNELLKNLGVNNSSVFLANCSIWVEGISDRNYIKAFLKAYCNEYNKTYPKEDIDFCFIEYAGSNLEHYDFDIETLENKIQSHAINNDILLIADLDSDKELKHEKYENITSNVFKYEKTAPYREVENLLSKSVLKKTLLDFCNKKKIKGMESIVQKNIDNEITKLGIKRKGKIDEFDKMYSSDYLGKLLSDLKKKVPEINKIWNEVNRKPSSINNKSEFSYSILNNKEITWADFSENPRVVELTEIIYNFITERKK